MEKNNITRKYNTHAEDLTGQRFGSLTVLERDFSVKDTQWWCRCDCGVIKSVRASNLRSGHTKSCGRRSKTCYQRPYKDLMGMTFGKLTVLRKDDERSDGNMGIWWLCQCDCGTIKSIQASHLIHGSAKSCGQTGCKERPSQDLVGQRYGYLTVIDYAEDITEMVKLRRKSKKADKFWKCKCDCGNITYATGNALKNGHKRSCGCKRYESGGEDMIKHQLDMLHIDHIRECHFDSLIGIGGLPLRYDFYLPMYNICIEFDGQHHFQPVQIFGGQEYFEKTIHHDQLKNEYCKEHNIQLIRIPYWKTDEEIKQIIENIQESRNDHSLEGNDKTYADNSPTLAS